MLEKSIACVARSGVITIVPERCPRGMVPLASSWNRPVLERAVCRASGRVRGNAVVIPGLRAGLDDDCLNFTVMQFREQLLAELSTANAEARSASPLS